MDISGWIDRNADFTPARTAIRFKGRDLTYADLADRVARAAGMLAQGLGIGRGDRIAFLGYNHPELLVLLFACARMGAMVVPFNWRLAPPEHARMLADAAPKAFFVEPDFTDQVAAMGDAVAGMQLVALDSTPEDWRDYETLMADAPALPAGHGGAGPDDGVLICYTSGATGVPKGAVLSQRALLFNAVNSAHMCAMTGADRILTNLPMFHVGGLNIQTVPGLHAGATIVLHDKFDPVLTFEDLEREKITLAILVPAQIMAMTQMPQWKTLDLSHLRFLSSGSTLVPHSLIRAVHDKGVPVLQVYGSTETAPIATYGTMDDAERKMGSAGKAALHCQVRVVDDGGADVAAGTSGEIVVRGPSVMTEYWRAPELTAEALKDGWFHSGDMGHFDADGFLFIDDRKKDMIISGAENIYPAELENVLADCAELDEAAVVGRADEKWGEVPVAVVVKKAGSDIDAAGVIGFFDGRIARYKFPRDVMFVDALPRNAMGKVIKDTVREMVAGGEG